MKERETCKEQYDSGEKKQWKTEEKKQKTNKEEEEKEEWQRGPRNISENIMH